MAQEFVDKTTLKSYMTTNYTDIIDIVNENIVNQNEVNDPNCLHVVKQIEYNVQSTQDSDECVKLKCEYLERKTDGRIFLKKITPFKTPSQTYSERIRSKIGVVIGSETLVGLIITAVDELAETARVTGYWDNAGTVTEKFHLCYAVPITLKTTTPNGDVFT